MITHYIRAGSVLHAVELLAQGYVPLAGGTQLNNPTGSRFGEDLEVVDLSNLQLTEIRPIDGEAKGENGGVSIGSMVSLQSLVESAGVPRVLREAAGFIPSRSVRNMATVGGNIGAGRPDSYLIPVLIAMGASVETATRRTGNTRFSEPEVRILTVEEYVGGDHSALILSVRVPRLPGVTVAVKESRSHMALPVVTAAVRLIWGEGTTAEAVVAAGCVGLSVTRLKGVEEEIVSGGWSEEDMMERGRLEALIGSAVDPPADILGSSEYKRYINSVSIADAIRRCVRERTRIAAGEERV
jgi:putative selenate reductase FAD-binding subunit